VHLVRLGEPPSEVSADVRAALSTWGPGSTVLGGLALLGIQPPGCPRVDAVIVLPRGLLVVVGVDLPDPAVRLEAPLDERWAIDGWPLTRQDGVVNPAAEALEAATAIAGRLQAMRAEPLPVSTVIAVGPYVSQVVQPSGDLHRGVRVLHPSHTTMLAAARELATCERPCSVEAAARLVAALGVEGAVVPPAELVREGFPDAVAPTLGTASTMLIPRVPAGPANPAPYLPGRPAAHPVPPVPPEPPARRANPRRLAIVAATVIVLLLIAGVVAAVSSADARGGPADITPQVNAVVDGVTFSRKELVRDTDCAGHASGDVREWLAQHPCTSMRRAVYETAVGSRRISVAVTAIDFADAPTAQACEQVADAPGAGGIADLMRDGYHLPGAASSFDNAARASQWEATEVRFTQAVWAEGASRPDEETLRHLARRALQLPAPS